MPNRVIREGLVDSRKVSSLSDFAFRVYCLLMVCVDDAGRLKATPEIVKAKTLPFSDRTIGDVEDAIQELDRAGLIYLYEWDCERYLQFLRWSCAGRSQHSRCPFDDGSFDIGIKVIKTRDGDKKFVATSLRDSGSTKRQLPQSDPGPTRVQSQSDFADTYTSTDTRTNTKTETEKSAATAARPGRGAVPAAYTPEFSEAFEAYRETGRGGKNKQESFVAWWKAIARIRSNSPNIDDPVSWLLGRIKAYAGSQEGRSEFSPLMSSWLNAARYDDDDSKWAPAAEAPVSRVPTLEDLKNYNPYATD